MRRYGVVAQSFGDLIESLLDFADDHDDEFEEFLGSKYAEEEDEKEE